MNDESKMAADLPVEEVVADALAFAGGEGGMSSISRFPEFYMRRAEVIVGALRDAGWLREAPVAALAVEQVRALVRLLYPDHMTPVAKRMIEAACDEVGNPPAENGQQVAT